jgi:uncharacterized OB-fold protein
MQQDSEQQCLPVAPGIFTTPEGGKSPELLGGHCDQCSQDYFPRPPRCPNCLGQIEEKNLGSSGKLYTYTVVRVRPPWGLPNPYGVGYVDLDTGGLRVLGLLSADALEDLEIGMPLRLAVGQLGCDVQGNPCLRPYFEPAGAQSSRGAS